MAVEGTQTDVDILVDGRTITCEKQQLMKESDYFRAMFESSMIESQTNTLTLHKQNFDDVSALIKSIQCGDLEIKPSTVNSLLTTAVFLQIPKAIHTCCSYLLKQLDDTTCLTLWMLAKTLSLETLYSKSKRHALFFFSSVCDTEAFCRLDVDEITEYLSHKHLNCDSELAVVNAIYKWYLHDKEGRETSVERVLDACVHVPVLGETKCRHLENHDLIPLSQAASQWLHQKIESQSWKTTEDITIYRQIPVCFLTIGGKTEGPRLEHGDIEKLCTDISKFDMTEGKFLPFDNPLKEIYPDANYKVGFQVTVVGKDLYITGGQPQLTRGRLIADVWKLDGFTNHWELATQLPLVRRHHGTCASNSDLYLLGGFGRYRELLNSFQKYDTISGEWTNMPALPARCFTPSAVFAGDKIYLHKDVYYSFCLRTHSWTKLTNVYYTFFSFNHLWYNNHVYEFTVDYPNTATLSGGGDSGDYAQHDPAQLWKYRSGIRKLNLETPTDELVYDGTSELRLGNYVAMCNGKLYIMSGSKQFVEVNMDDFHDLKVLGEHHKGVAPGAFLVALPDYPSYKITSSDSHGY